jgi:hypothetical protein
MAFMMKLEYAGGELLISDGLSHALMDYSSAIARTAGSANLEIPVLTLDGVRGLAELVIGPASQLLAAPTDAPNVDLGDGAIIDDILSRTAALGPHSAVPFTEPDPAEDLDGFL